MNNLLPFHAKLPRLILQAGCRDLSPTRLLHLHAEGSHHLAQAPLTNVLPLKRSLIQLMKGPFMLRLTSYSYQHWESSVTKRRMARLSIKKKKFVRYLILHLYTASQLHWPSQHTICSALYELCSCLSSDAVCDAVYFLRKLYCWFSQQVLNYWTRLSSHQQTKNLQDY